MLWVIVVQDADSCHGDDTTGLSAEQCICGSRWVELCVGCAVCVLVCCG